MLSVVLERTGRKPHRDQSPFGQHPFKMVLWSSNLKAIFKTKDFCFPPTVRQSYLFLSQEKRNVCSDSGTGPWTDQPGELSPVVLHIQQSLCLTLSCGTCWFPCILYGTGIVLNNPFVHYIMMFHVTGKNHSAVGLCRRCLVQRCMRYVPFHCIQEQDVVPQQSQLSASKGPSLLRHWLFVLYWVEHRTALLNHTNFRDYLSPQEIATNQVRQVANSSW